MSTAVVCLTYNKLPFLRDFLKSHEENSLPDTKLFVGIQGCEKTIEFARSYKGEKHVAFVVYQDNIGLNRYHQLVQEWVLPHDNDLLIEADDDTILPLGYEDVFRDILIPRQNFGFIGIKQKGVDLLPVGENREFYLQQEGNRYQVVESAVCGALAATTIETYRMVGGFGIGATIFDPEDARYQRKCLMNNLICGNVINHDFEHHNSWEWAIKYGTAQQKMNNLHEALMAGFLSDENYRAMIMQYTEVLDG